MDKHEKTCGSYPDGSPCFPEEQLCLLPAREPVWLSAIEQAGKRGHLNGILTSCNCLESLVTLAHLKLFQPLKVGLDKEKIPNGFLQGVGALLCSLGSAIPWVAVNGWKLIYSCGHCNVHKGAIERK